MLKFCQMLFLCLLSSYDFYPSSLFIKDIGLCFSFCVVSFYGLDMSKADLIKWSKFVWEGFKSRASVSWSQLALPDQSPSGELAFPVRVPWAGVLDVGLFCNILSTGQHTGVGALERLSLSHSPVSTWLPLLFRGSDVLLILVLRSYLESLALSIVGVLECMGGSELRIIRL